MRKPGPLSYLLLVSVYLLYLPDAELVVDDWKQFLFYRQHQVHGWAGQMEIFRTLLQNKLYSVFQLFWLSYSLDSLVVSVVGYAPRVLFALALLLHVANSWLLYRLCIRLRVEVRIAYLAGACFLLVPTVHSPLFWVLNNGLYRLTPFFFLLYLLSLAQTLETGNLTRRGACWQSLLVAVVLYCGGAHTFHLLLFGGLWMAVSLFPRDRWKVVARAIGLHWVVIVLGLAVYVPFLNRIPLSGEQIAARYDFSRDFLMNNWRKFYAFHLPGMSGFGPRAYYHLEASAAQLLAAGLAALVVFWFARRLPAGAGGRSLSRISLFAAGMIVLAYAPLIFLVGGTLRHYYTLSPYLSLLLIALCGMLPRGRVAAAAALCAWFAACTVAEIQQCWAPMSRQAQSLKAGLRQLRNLAPGDPVVVPGTLGSMGTAPNFTGASGVWDRYFAEYVTGVQDLEFWREIVIEKGRPRLFRRDAMRDASIAQLERAHVLTGGPAGPYLPKRYWSDPAGRLHCLQDFPCAQPPDPAAVAREQVYFPKPFEHGNVGHLHY